MKRMSLVFAAALLAAAGFAAAGHETKMHGLRFVTALEFSAPEKAGLDALLVFTPREARAGAEKMSVTAVRFPKDAVGEGGMSDAELLEYVKAAFMAETGTGEPAEREFLGRKVIGESFAKTIPAPARAEIYVLGLKSGDKVVLGFAFAPGFAAQAAQAITEISATLAE